VETGRAYSKRKDTGEVNKKGKYKQEKREASYKNIEAKESK